MKRVGLMMFVFLIFSYDGLALERERKLFSVAVYSEFAQDIFIGAVYYRVGLGDGWLNNKVDSIDRLEYRISAKRLAKSDFIALVWSWADFASSAFAQSQAAKSLSELNPKIKSLFYRGDSVAIELTSTSKTRVLMNNHILLETETTELFNFIKASWLGQRAPKRVFKETLLAGMDLATVELYSRLSVDKQRTHQVGSWLVQDANRLATASNKRVSTNPRAKPAVMKVASKKTLGSARQFTARSVEKKAAQAQWKEYVSSIIKPLYASVKYPSSAKRRKIQGRVLIGVDFNGQGELLNIYVQEASGSNTLDKAALSAIDASSPWPSPPRVLTSYFSDQRGIYSLSVPFSFVINEVR